MMLHRCGCPGLLSRLHNDRRVVIVPLDLIRQAWSDAICLWMLYGIGIKHRVEAREGAPVQITDQRQSSA